MGNIGYNIAKKAFLAFGMRIYYYDIVRKSKEQEESVDAIYCDTFDGLVGASDCVILATPFSGKKIIDAERLQKFKKGSRFVNIARGSLVDEDALITALRSGRLFAAGLDVQANEPHVHPGFAEMSNVTLTCHNAGGAMDTNIGFERLAMENIEKVLTGQEALTPVNKHLMKLEA
jgi:lactate dehydrogenase-like 2-hydroxyacid dehydrogenase